VRRFNALRRALFMLCGGGALALMLVAAPLASAAGTTYTAETPVVDTVEGGPWNTSQGDPSLGGEYPSSDLLPTFSFGGPETTLGGVSEPNLAVYPGEQKVIENGKEVTKLIPYPSGVAGTPGPLSGYCNTEESENEQGSPVSQPAGSKLPFSPYYFPDVVRNPDGSLTGYFDYRPKDADEAITVARSTDNGKTWVAEGKALEQNPGYCPTADTNDDGQGHPYVAPIGGSTKLYTLQRPAGDYEGVGLLVHNVEPSAADPLAALPGSESVGIDPNTYAEAEIEVPTSGGVSIPVSTLGEANSPEHIVAGPYEDYNASSPSKSIITCKGTTAAPAPAELTECTVAGSSPLTVKAKDDIVQVIATANPGEGKTYTVPAGPNLPSGEGGLKEIKFVNGNSSVSPLSTFILNENAPNRVYIDGVTVYCVQSNANPTTKIENCTTDSNSPLTVNQGDAITADPILPPHAAVTTGLKAPDGIVGTLPSYPGAPAGSTVVLYTEKLLAYFVVGTTDGFVEGSKFEKKTIKLPKSTITYTPSVHPSEPLPSNGTFKIYLGTTKEGIQQVTCTGVATANQTGAPAGSDNLTGCSGGTGEVEEGFWIGGPNAATAPVSALEKIGEGKSTGKGPEKLFANNEDYTVLRAAYTENGVNFTDLGPISGSTSGTGNDSGSYNDISNPFQTTSPSTTEPTNLAPGELDTTELRFVGSRGTIITNPNGSYGMFLSGSWATDGDSDAFNQIFYTESANGKEWSVPKVVLSTEYKFAASAAQDKALAEGHDEPLGISAYYSGRAYGPAVVQNPDGSLTMVFSGYRLPKPVEKAGKELGTNLAQRYTIGAKDPALYRNILTVQLTSATTPGVATSTSVSASDEGSGVVGAPVTYTATLAPVAPGAGTPTGTVSFADSHGAISGCANRPLNDGTPDTATCTTTHERPPGADEITATYSGDSNYEASSGTASESVLEAPTITSGASTTFTEGHEGSFPVSVEGDPTPSVEVQGTLPHGVKFDEGTDKLYGTPTQEGVFKFAFKASNSAGFVTQSFTLTVDAPPAITSADEATFNDHSPSSFTVSATGTPAPTITKWGNLPEGVSLSNGVLSGTPTQIGSFQITLTATNALGSSTQQFTLTVVGLHVTTTSLPNVTLGVPYSDQLEAVGGVTPFKWTKVSGKLPVGLKLSSTGLLSGKVALKKYAPGTSFPFVVKVTDSTKKTHQTVTASLALTIE
jgi:Bacterial Ig-like domain (group 3)